MFKRIFCILLIQVFLLSNISFAIEDISEHRDRDVEIKSSALAVDSLSIPRDFGTIKERASGANGKIVLYIQDAHCNYEAQSNIANILEYLIKNYNVDFVAVEGADGIVDTSWFKAFPDNDIKREVADYFMKKGEITGAEFLSITSDYPFTIYGAEDRKYYVENLNSFLESYPYKEEFVRYYTSVKITLDKLKKYIYTKELLAIDSKVTEHKEKKIKFADYIKYLDTTAKGYNINLKEYINFSILLEALRYEKDIDFDNVNEERAVLIDDLSKKLNKEELSELVNKSLAFKLGKIDGPAFYAYLAGLASDNGISITETYKNLSKYIVYTKIYSKIENEMLFDEIDNLVSAVKEKLFQNDSQRILDKLWKNVNIVLGFINIELTNKEYEYYVKHKNEFVPSSFVSFVDEQSSNYGISYSVTIPEDHLNKVFERLIDFYEIALKRDKVLVDNLFKGMHGKKTDVAILITGGFHTKGITKFLQEKEASYVVISPCITKDEKSPYLEVLTGQKTPFEELIISAEKSQLAPPSMLNKICRGLGVKPFKNEPFTQEFISPLTEDFPREFAKYLMQSYITVFSDKPSAALKQQLLDRLREIWLKHVGQSRGKMFHDIVVGEIDQRFDQTYADMHINGDPNRTPGEGAVRRTGINKPLTADEIRAMDQVIKATIQERKAREVFEHVTSGVFVVLEDETFDKYARQFGAPLDVECHPGTRGTRSAYIAGKPETYNQVHRRYYIRESQYNRLTPQERVVWAMHEELHIKIALGIVKVPHGMSEEEFINSQPGCDVRPIMARLGSVAHMEDILLSDIQYGDAAKRYIEAERAVIDELGKQNKITELRERETALERFIKTVYTRRHNMDRMKSIFTEEPYQGYDVIIISSTTPDEAEYQKKVLEKAFEGQYTENGDLNHKVCILSVLDEAFGGQIIGQINTWDKAKEDFKEWARQNNATTDDLDVLFRQNKIKTAIYHNGGKGERASPATQSLGNSRGAQKLIGHVLNSEGEKVDLELILGVVLETSPLAATNDGSRIDTFWSNQLAFGTIDFTQVERTNFHFDKFVIKVPAKPRMKDLFDYGTAILSPAGKIIRFLANKVLTRKNEATGEYEPNPEYREQMTELLDAAKGVLDYGSFSMSREMHYALYDYWANIKQIFDVMSANQGEAGVSRDIDPALVQILVPLCNGLEGKELPQGLPSADQLRGMQPSEQKNQLLDQTYKSLIALMDERFRRDLEVIYAKDKLPIYESVEFFVLYKDMLFKDLTRVIGHIDMGEDSHWFAYKRLLDMANEKFIMLADIIDENMELASNGDDIRTPSDIMDKVRAEDARRMRRIRNDAVAVFEVEGHRITLSAEQMREGWEGYGVRVKGSIIQGNCVLLPGSVVIDSVLSDAQGEIIARNSYVESPAATRLEAINSIVYRSVEEGSLRAEREIVADAFRPQISDPRFPEGQTRMRGPIGYDPKPREAKLRAEMSDSVKFGDNKYSFEAIRNLPCNRTENDSIEASVRNRVLGNMRASIKARRTQNALRLIKSIFAEQSRKAKSDSKTLAVALRNFEEWLTNDKFIEYHEALLDLVELAETDKSVAKELYDSFWRTIPFGTGGRRWKVGIGPNRMNAYMAAMTAQGHVEYLRQQYGEQLKRGDVVVGAWDVRAFHKFFAEVESLRRYRETIEAKCPALAGLSSEDLSKIVALVYAGNGISYIHSEEMRSTPWLSFVVNRYSTLVEKLTFTGRVGKILKSIKNVVAGIVLSSSHNPYDNNGTKFYENSGAQAPPQIVQMLMDLGDSVESVNYYAADVYYKQGREAAFQKAVEDGKVILLEGDNLKAIDEAYFETVIEEIKSMYTEEEWERLKPWFEKLLVSFNAINGTGVTNIIPILEQVRMRALRSDGDVSTWEFPEGYGNIPNPEAEKSFNTAMQIGIRRTLNWVFDEEVTTIKSIIDEDGNEIAMDVLERENESAFNNADEVLDHFRQTRSKFIRGIVLNAEDRQTEEIIRAFSILNNICLLTDPDADRVGLGLQKIESVDDKIRLEWVSANDNDESGIILFRYRLERLRDMAKRGELINFIESKRREDGKATSKSGKYQLIIVNTVVSNPLEIVIAERLSKEIADLTDGRVSVKVLTHHVGFKFTGEIIDNINRGEFNGITGEIMKRSGVDLDEAYFVMSSEEGEGSLIGYRGSIDKDSGVTGFALSVLAAELLSQNKTMYEYLMETYEKYGYSKTYLEPMVMTGDYGFMMINTNIMGYLRTEVLPAVKRGDTVQWGSFTLKDARDHYDLMKPQYGDDPEQWPQAIRESVNILEFDAELPDGTTIRIVARPSGTEPKHKNLVMTVGVPLKVGESLTKYIEKINSLNREVMDAVMIACYRASKAEYESAIAEKPGTYKVEDLSDQDLKELLKIFPIIVACEAKLGIYFPLRDYVKEKSEQMARLVNFDEYERVYTEVRGAVEKYLINFKEENGIQFIEESVRLNLMYQIEQLPQGIGLGDERIKALYTQAILWFGENIGGRYFVTLLQEKGFSKDELHRVLTELTGNNRKPETPGSGSVRRGDSDKGHLRELVDIGTKYSLDSVDPDLIDRELQNGATSATSNPIIISDIVSRVLKNIEKNGRPTTEFEKKIYDVLIKGDNEEQATREITVIIIKDAAAKFRPIYDRTNGDDGYVSIEVDPRIEDKEAGPYKNMTHQQRVDEVVRQAVEFSKIAPNIFIKVPATDVGLDALQELAYRGINLNVTLIFTQRQAKIAREAVYTGLMMRKQEGKHTRVKSVYSIFVSRTDAYTEKQANLEMAQNELGTYMAKLIYMENKAFWQGTDLPLTHEMIFASTGNKGKEVADIKKEGDVDRLLMMAQQGDEDAKGRLIAMGKYVYDLAGSDIQTNPPLTAYAVNLAPQAITERRVDQLPPQQVRDIMDEYLRNNVDKLEEDLMKEGIDKFVKPQVQLVQAIKEAMQPAIHNPVDLMETIYKGEVPQAVNNFFKAYPEIAYRRALVELSNTMFEKNNELYKMPHLTSKQIKEYREEFYRLIAEEAVNVENPEVAIGLQVISAQAINILSWIDRNVPGAVEIRLTDVPSDMVRATDKDRGLSYLDITSLQNVTTIEGHGGFYWRGREGAEKLGDTLLQDKAYADNATESARLVMYIMDHGLVPVPKDLKVITSHGQLSTLHQTTFVNRRIPKSIQYTSTGKGHWQGQKLDVKQVTKGAILQMIDVYDRYGKKVKTFAHVVNKGEYTIAIPGTVDYMIPLTDVVQFNDISIDIKPEVLHVLNPHIDINDIGNIEKAVEGARQSSYTVADIAGAPVLVKADQEAPEVEWITYKFPERISGRNLVDIYTSASLNTIGDIIQDVMLHHAVKVETAPMRMLESGPEAESLPQYMEALTKLNETIEARKPVKFIPALKTGYSWGEQVPVNFILDLMGAKDEAARIALAAQYEIPANAVIGERWITAGLIDVGTEHKLPIGVLSLWAGKVFGSEHVHSFGAESGITAKLLTSARPLSVQVHNFPEMIVPLADGYAFLGLSRNVSKQELIDALKRGDESILNRVELKKGVPIVVPAGMIHAYGNVKVYEVKAVAAAQDVEGTKSLYDRLKLTDEQKRRVQEIMAQAKPPEELARQLVEEGLVEEKRQHKDVLTAKAADVEQAANLIEKLGGLKKADLSEVTMTPSLASDEKTANEAKFEIVGLTEDFIAGRYTIQWQKSIEADRLMQGRLHSLLVTEGKVELLNEQGEKIDELKAGDELMIPAEVGKYTLVALEGPAVVYTQYKPVGAEKLITGVHATVFRQFAGRLRGKKIDFISPQEGFKDGEKKELEDFIREMYGVDAKIVLFQAGTGLSSIQEKSLRKDALKVLVATKKNYEKADLNDDFQRALLEDSVKMPALPSVDSLQKNDKFFNLEIMVAGAALAIIEIKDDKVDIMDLEKIQDVFSQLTRRPLTPEDIFCLMRYNVVNAANLLPEGRQTLSAIVHFLQGLLMSMPTKPVDVEQELHRRREIIKSL